MSLPPQRQVLFGVSDKGVHLGSGDVALHVRIEGDRCRLAQPQELPKLVPLHSQRLLVATGVVGGATFPGVVPIATSRLAVRDCLTKSENDMPRNLAQRSDSSLS